MSASCPRGSTFDARTGSCILQCTPGYSYISGDCVKECPPNMVLNNQKVCIRPVFSHAMFTNDITSQKSFILFGTDSSSLVYGAFDETTKDIAFETINTSTKGPVKQVQQFAEDPSKFWIFEDQSAGNTSGVPSQTFEAPVEFVNVENLGTSMGTVNPQVASAGTTTLFPEIRKMVYMPTRSGFLGISDSTPSQIQSVQSEPKLQNNESVPVFKSVGVAYDENAQGSEIAYVSGSTGSMQPDGSIAIEAVTNQGTTSQVFDDASQRASASAIFDVTTAIQSRRPVNGEGFLLAGYSSAQTHAQGSFTTSEAAPGGGLNVYTIDLNFDNSKTAVWYPDPPVVANSGLTDANAFAKSVLRVDTNQVSDTNGRTDYVFVRGNTTQFPAPAFSYIRENGATQDGNPIGPMLPDLTLYQTTVLSGGNYVTQATVPVDSIVSYGTAPIRFAKATSTLASGALVFDTGLGPNLTAVTNVTNFALPDPSVLSTKITCSAYDSNTKMAVFGFSNTSEEDVVVNTVTYDQQLALDLSSVSSYGTVSSIVQINDPSNNTPVDPNVGWSGKQLTIPTNCTRVHVILWGAGGSCDNATYDPSNPHNGGGGAGAFLEGDLDTSSWSPGDVLEVFPGQGGASDTFHWPLRSFGNGGAGRPGDSIGQGGGRTYIYNSTTSTEIVTVGSGGGSLGSGFGGAGGIASGESGRSVGTTTLSCGLGATQSAGGLGGSEGSVVASSGTIHEGANAEISGNEYSGGAGSGYFGGGAAADANSGSGGGSSYTTNLISGYVGMSGSFNLAPNTNHKLYPGNYVGTGGSTASPTSTGISTGGHGFAIVQFYVSDAPATPTENTFGQALAFTTVSNWTDYLGSLATKLETFTFDGSPASGDILSVSIADGIILACVSPTGSDWIGWNTYTKDSVVSYGINNTLYIATEDVPPNESSPDVNTDYWTPFVGPLVYFTTFNLPPSPTSDSDDVFTVNTDMKRIVLPRPMSSINSVRSIPNAVPTFVLLGSGIQVLQYNQISLSWSFHSGRIVGFPDFDESFECIDGAFQSSTNEFSIAAVPRSVKIGIEAKNATVAPKFSNDPSRPSKMATNGTVVVSSGGPFIDPNTQDAFVPSDYSIRFQLNTTTQQWRPYLYYENEPFIFNSAPLAAQDIHQVYVFINASGNPFWLRSPANLMYSLDGGYSFQPAIDGSNKEYQITKYMHTFFEGLTSADVAPGTSITMKSSFSSVVWVPTAKVFLAAGSFLWDINTIWDGSLPLSSNETTLGNNVMWKSSDGISWITVPIQLSLTDEPNNDSFWICTSLEYSEETEQLFLTTSDGVYTFNAQNISDTAITVTSISSINCVQRDSNGNCVSCSTGTFAETINVVQDAGGSAAPEQVCLYAPNQTDANDKAETYNGYVNNVSITTSTATSQAFSGSSVIVNLWGSGGGNPQSANSVSGGGAAFISGLITFATLRNDSRFSFLTQTGSIYLYFVVGQIGGSTLSTGGGLPASSNAVGAGGGFSGVFLDETNGTGPLTYKYPLLIAGGGGGGGSIASLSVGGNGGITQGGSGSTGVLGTPGSGGNNNTVQQFVPSQMFGKASSTTAGAGAGGYVGGSSGSSLAGGGGGSSFADICITVLNTQAGYMVSPYNGIPAQPGGINDATYPNQSYGQSNSQGLIVVINEADYVAIMPQTSSGLKFVGLCGLQQTIKEETPTNDDELFCSLDTCLSLSGKETSIKSLLYSATFSSSGANTIGGDTASTNLGICSVDALTKQGMFFQGTSVLPTPSVTDTFPSLDSNGQIIQTPLTISTTNWNKTWLPTGGSYSPPNVVTVPNWSNYGIQYTDVNNNVFLDQGTGNIVLQDVEYLLSNVNYLTLFNAYNPSASNFMIGSLAGLLPTNCGVNSTGQPIANTFTKPLPMPRNTDHTTPNPILVAPMTLKNYTSITTNLQRIITTNFYRPRNWSFILDVSFDPVIVEPVSQPTVTLLSDQPDENGNNEFLHPDPVDVWASTGSDPDKNVIVAPARAAYWKVSSVNPLTFTSGYSGYVGAWFGKTPLKNVVYAFGCDSFNGLPYMVKNTDTEYSPHLISSYMMDLKTANVSSKPTWLDPSDDSDALLNVFINVSKLYGSYGFDWTDAVPDWESITEPQVDPYVLPAGVTLLDILSLTGRFDPMKHIMFSYQDKHYCLHDLDRLFKSIDETAYVTVIPYNGTEYLRPTSTVGNQVLGYSPYLMTASIPNYDQTYANTYEFGANAQGGSPTYQCPTFTAGPGVLMTAYIWFSIRIKFPTAAVLPELPTSIWTSKGYAVNVNDLTIAVEDVLQDPNNINSPFVPQIPFQDTVSTVLANSGPRIEMFEAQPLVLTRYLQDRFQQWTKYYETAPNTFSQYGFNVEIPFFNPHYIAPQSTDTQYITGYYDMTSAVTTETVVFTDPEFMCVPENELVFQVGQASRLTDARDTATLYNQSYPKGSLYNSGKSEACYMYHLDENNQATPLGASYVSDENILVFGDAPRMFVGGPRNPPAPNQAISQIGSTDGDLIYELQSSYSLRQATNALKVVANANTMTIQFHQAPQIGEFYQTAACAYLVVNPKTTISQLYMTFQNPQKQSGAYKWVVSIVKTRFPSTVGSTVINNKNFEQQSVQLDYGVSANIQQFYRINNPIYWFQYTTGVPEAPFSYTNAGSTTVNDQSTVTSYDLDYESTYTGPLATRVLQVPLPTSIDTYIWRSDYTCFAYEINDNLKGGHLYLTQNGLGGPIDFSSFGNDTARKAAIVAALQNTITQALVFMIVNQGNFDADDAILYGKVPINEPYNHATNGNFSTANFTWGYDASNRITLTISNSSYPDYQVNNVNFSLNVRSMDPISKQVLGLSRVSKVLMQMDLSQPNFSYTLTFPDPMYFGPFSDTAIIITPVKVGGGSYLDITPELKASDDFTPIVTATSSAPNQPWLTNERENNRTFEIGFFESLDNLIVNPAIPATINYKSFSSGSYANAVSNTSLTRNIDPLFSLTESYQAIVNNTTNPSGIVKYMTSNSTALIPDPLGATGPPGYTTIGVADGYAGNTFLTYPETLNTTTFVGNYNGLDLYSSASAPGATVPAVPTNPRLTFKNFYWNFWPWNNFSYTSARAPSAKPPPGWFFPTDLDRLGTSDPNSAQIASVGTSNTLATNFQVLLGGSDGRLRKAVFSGASKGTILDTSLPTAFSIHGNYVSVGRIRTIKNMNNQWFVLTDLGPFSTIGSSNDPDDIANGNVSRLRFTPVFDTSGASAIKVADTSILANWIDSVDVSTSDTNTSTVLFMKYVVLEKRPTLVFGDIYNNVVCVFYHKQRLVYSHFKTSSASIPNGNYGGTSATDIVVLANNKCSISSVDANTLVLGTSILAAQPVLQYIPDAKVLLSTRKNALFDINEAIRIRAFANIALPVHDFFNPIQNNVESIFNDFGPAIISAFEQAAPVLQHPLYTYVYQDLHTTPLIVTDWTNILSLQTQHNDVSTPPSGAPYAARFTLTINDTTLFPLEVVTGGTQAPVKLIFEGISKDFFNMGSKVDSNNSIQFPPEAIVPVPFATFIDGPDYAPNDQNEPQWFKSAFFKFSMKHKIENEITVVSSKYTATGFPQSMFSNLLTYSMNEVDNNAYVSDIVYVPEVDVAVWAPVGSFGGSPLKVAYNMPNALGTISAIQSSTSPIYVSKTILGWNKYRNLIYAAGVGQPTIQRESADTKLRMLIVQNNIPTGSTSGSTVAPPDAYSEVTWTYGGIANFLSDKFDTVAAMDFSPTVDAIAGSKDNQTCIWYKYSTFSWQKLGLVQTGTVTAIKFVNFGWYIASWDGTSSYLWFASVNMTVVAYVDAWDSTDRSVKVTSIDYALTSLTGTCAPGFEPSTEDPNVCYKICPYGYEAYNSQCVLSCPYTVGPLLNQCIPPAYTPNRVSPVARISRNDSTPSAETSDFSAIVENPANTASAVKWAVAGPAVAAVAAAIYFAIKK